MDRLKAYMAAEWKKICALEPGERPGYIWMYYKLWIIAIVVIVGFAVTMTWHAVTTPSETWFFACFANVTEDLGEGSDLYDGFAAYAGYDLTRGQLQFEDSIYCNPATSSTTGSAYYEQMIAYLDGGTLDVLVMNTDDLLAVGESGRLMSLSDERVSALLETYSDRILTVEADLEGDGTLTEVPVGIDLSGSLLEEYYGGDCALGISANAPHIDQIDLFLRYLFSR
ncbi:MAG: hypothetical protein LUC30_09690 [Clostridiales bacterium]|nr:hypothetical protein [Clostridiales bacterium]